MSSEKLETLQIESEPCGDTCLICLGTWAKIHMPVYRSSLIDFFQSSVVANKFPIEIDLCKCNSTSNLLWENRIGSK